MTYETLSKKQLAAMLWWSMDAYQDLDGVLCDGSVRSGKTMSMSVGFVLWSMSRYRNQTFALCGKTIEALRRNVVNPLRTWLEGLFTVREHRAQNYIEIFYGDTVNRYYLFGGKDESSAALIQGITLAGVLLDEVALMPRSFVEQALARCSVAGSKFWFNCNPESSEHWFYREWVQKAKEKRVLHLHLTMDDNPSLDEAVKKRHERLYSGVFYDRYIRGLWCIAEGLVYPMFDRGKNVAREHGTSGDYYISIDYGTLNPTAMGLWRVDGDTVTMEREYYYDGREQKRQKTDEEYYADLESFAGGVPIVQVIIDPSAASFRECIRRHGKFRVKDAKNDVLDGIRFTASLMASEKLKIHESCENTMRELGAYAWDGKATEDKVIKANDHSMDQMRYLCYTLRRRIKAGYGDYGTFML